jgi:hypothetical protein
LRRMRKIEQQRQYRERRQNIFPHGHCPQNSFESVPQKLAGKPQRASQISSVIPIGSAQRSAHQ